MVQFFYLRNRSIFPCPGISRGRLGMRTLPSSSLFFLGFFGRSKRKTSGAEPTSMSYSLSIFAKSSMPTKEKMCMRRVSFGRRTCRSRRRRAAPSHIRARAEVSSGGGRQGVRRSSCRSPSATRRRHPSPSPSLPLACRSSCRPPSARQRRHPSPSPSLPLACR